MVSLKDLSNDTAVVNRITKSSFTVVETETTTFSFSVGDFASKYEAAEQGFFATLKKRFDFWVLFYYALECGTLDNFMTVIDDGINYEIDYSDYDSTVTFLALEYFHQMLYDVCIAPAFDLLGMEFNHTTSIKVLGKEGLVVWLKVL